MIRRISVLVLALFLVSLALAHTTSAASACCEGLWNYDGNVCWNQGQKVLSGWSCVDGGPTSCMSSYYCVAPGPDPLLN